MATIPPAKVGDICIIVEPSLRDMSRLRQLQQTLQIKYGGRPQGRIHFTTQRFTPPQNGGLSHLITSLHDALSAVPAFPVTALSLEWAAHPFWLFDVLRWDLTLNDEIRRFGAAVERALRDAGATLHYPCGEGWSPHVTALERLPARRRPLNAVTPTFQYLYTGQRIVLSQVQPGKKFADLGTINLVMPQPDPPLPPQDGDPLPPTRTL